MSHQQERLAQRPQPPQPQVPISADDYRKTYNILYSIIASQNSCPDANYRAICRETLNDTDWLIG